jgi:hypothetical protein
MFVRIEGSEPPKTTPGALEPGADQLSRAAGCCPSHGRRGCGAADDSASFSGSSRRTHTRKGRVGGGPDGGLHLVAGQNVRTRPGGGPERLDGAGRLGPERSLELGGGRPDRVQVRARRQVEQGRARRLDGVAHARGLVPAEVARDRRVAGPHAGARNCSTWARKPGPFMAPSSTSGAPTPSARSAAVTAVVRQCLCAIASAARRPASARRPRGATPCWRSPRPCPATKRPGSGPPAG